MKYDIGRGTPENDELAGDWYTRAAEQGHVKSEYNLSVLDADQGASVREDGRFTEERLEPEAEEKYKNVALKPDFQALVIRQGRAPGRDTAEWYAVRHEEEDRTLKLVPAEKYVERSPVLGSNTTPEAWFTPTAERGSPNAQFSLALVYDLGEGVAENDETAARWYAEAAGQGHVWARYNLALAYDRGEGVTKNEETAVSWYLQAAEQGDMKSQFGLGVKYSLGGGVTKSDEAAFSWYTVAAEQGMAQAQYNLAVAYDVGRGVAEDQSLAVKWYRRAAEQGDVNAMFNLGVKNETGKGIPQDFEKAVARYMQAARAGHAKAQYNLALKYFTGEGVKRSNISAHMWANIARANNVPRSKKLINVIVSEMTPQQIATAQRRARACSEKQLSGC